MPELQKARPATLQQFFQQHQCRDQAKNQARIADMHKTIAITHDGAVMTAGRAAVCAAVRLHRGLGQSLQDYDQQIEESAQAHPDFQIFASLPAAGAAFAPRLILALGTQRDRYGDAAAIQQFSGIAPSDGNQWKPTLGPLALDCPKLLRQIFQEWAAQTMQQCDWAAAYYRVQRDDKKKSHHGAVRSLAYKWIHIVFRCWKDRQQYDDSRYEEALTRQQHKATAKSLQPSPFELPVQWISCAGFQKIASKNP